MQKRPPTGRHWVWAGLFATILLAACGGGGGSPSGSTPAPKARLSVQLNGPSQARTGEPLQINGNLDLSSADPAAMEWQLLERPAGSQAALPPGGSSSQLLTPDRPGRYVVQWTVSSADGERIQRQLAVDAVEGPLIETAAPTGQLQLGQATLLLARQPAAATDGITAYRWTLLQGPSGSNAKLSGLWGSEVSLKADIAGEYQVQVEAHQGETVTKTVRTLSASTARTIAIYPGTYCSFVLGCNKAVDAPVSLRLWYSEPIGNAKVSYQWTLLSKPPASKLADQLGSGETAVFVPDVIGDYYVEVQASSPDLSISGGGGRLYVHVVSKPTGNIQAPSEVLVGRLVTLDSTANQTYDGRLIAGVERTWTLVKVPKGSSAVIDPGNWGSPIAKFKPDRPGDYVISLGFYELPGYATVTVHASSADPLVMYPPKVLAPSGLLVPGEEGQFTAESASELGHSIVHEWKFGDGSSATGDSVSHSYAYPGTYQLQVIARDTETQRFARQTVPITVVANRLDNIQPVPCKLQPCAAAAADSYVDRGLGRWQLVNDRPHTQAVNIDIGGVSAGRQVLLSLSNASGDDAGTAELGQSVGMGPRPVQSANASAMAYQLSMTQAPASTQQRRDEAHAEHLARDRALALALLAPGNQAQAKAGRRVIQSAAPRQALPVPDLGSSRDWQDATAANVYKSRLADSCELPGGRQILFWLDEKARAQELLGANQLAQDLKPIVCGAQGGFQKLQKLLNAEVFGLHERNDIISDAALQPVQILLADPGPDVYWGAYVYSGDLVRKANLSRSNEAVLMVVNARYIKTDLNFIKSTLIHEFMHQVNNYQRWVLNNWIGHESWLEETTAMMAEDLVSSDLITQADGSRFAPMAPRIAAYQASPVSSQFLGGFGANYSIGGSLAGYLNRRLGAFLLRGLTFNCPNEGQIQGSLRCLDEQVFQLSGKGLAEHYGAMNASVAGQLYWEDGPNLGLPPYVSDEVNLPGIDLKTVGKTHFDQVFAPWRLLPGSHIYLWESTTAAANGRYRRKGIMVPPGHVLQILIR